MVIRLEDGEEWFADSAAVLNVMSSASLNCIKQELVVK